MALHSPQRTAEEIADLVHASHITALHTARILRTAIDAKGKRRGLWPQPGSGKRIASYTATQMVNLLLALAASDPIRAPAIIAEFRNLRFGKARWTHTRLEGHPNALETEPVRITSRASDRDLPLFGDTLGEHMDAMIEKLADDDTPDDIRRQLRATGIMLTFRPVRAATLLIPTDDAVLDVVCGELPDTTALFPCLLTGSAGETKGAMEALAAIWRENQEALRLPPNETAATHPCPGTNAAVASQPPAIEHDHERGHQTPPVLSEREIAFNGSPAGSYLTEERHADVRETSFDPIARRPAWPEARTAG